MNQDEHSLPKMDEFDQQLGWYGGGFEGDPFVTRTEKRDILKAIKEAEESGKPLDVSWYHEKLRFLIKNTVTTVSDRYDENFGNDRLCTCGHPYYRHFDTYDDMRPVGCKYCYCEHGFTLAPGQ